MNPVHLPSEPIVVASGAATDTPSPATAPRLRRPNRTMVRTAGSVVLALAALVILIGFAPAETVTAEDIAAVMAHDSINQDSADSAPKQTVVNGWTSRDLLELIAKRQLAVQDSRPPALLTLAVLAICLGVATSGAATTRTNHTPSAGPTASASNA